MAGGVAGEGVHGFVPALVAAARDLGLPGHLRCFRWMDVLPELIAEA